MTPLREDAAQLGLGSVQWGQRYGIANASGQPSLAEVADILAVARAGGIATIDTARDYGDSEERIGSLVRRGEWRIITKLTAALPTTSAADAVASAQASVEASVRALRTTSLDTLLLHRSAHLDAWDGAVWRALGDYRDAGVIRHLGVSALDPREAWSALGNPSIDVIQVASNLFDQRLFRGGFFAAAQEAGKEVFVRSVFLQGVGHVEPERLPVRLADLRQPLQHIRQRAEARGWPPFAPFLYFAYGLGQARVVVGAETARQIEESLGEWSFAAERYAETADLAAEIPSLPDSVLNPWEW